MPSFRCASHSAVHLDANSVLGVSKGMKLTANDLLLAFVYVPTIFLSGISTTPRSISYIISIFLRMPSSDGRYPVIPLEMLLEYSFCPNFRAIA